MDSSADQSKKNGYTNGCQIHIFLNCIVNMAQINVYQGETWGNPYSNALCLLHINRLADEL